MPYFWFAVPAETPALPYPTVFTDRFWDGRKPHDGWERTGPGTNDMTPWFGPVPPFALGDVQGDADAWANGYLYSDYLAGRVPVGNCWQKDGGKGGGGGGGRLYFAERRKVPGGGGGGGVVLLAGVEAARGGGSGGGGVELLGLVGVGGGGSCGGAVGLAGRLSVAGGGSGAGAVGLAGRLSVAGGGSGGGAVGLAGLVAVAGGGSGGGAVGLDGLVAVAGGGSGGGGIALDGLLAVGGGGSGGGGIALDGLLAVAGGGSGGGTVSLTAVPAPGPGATCLTAGTILRATTHGATVAAGVTQWWQILALPAATYTVATTASGGPPHGPWMGSKGTCAGLTPEASFLLGTGGSLIHSGGTLFIQITGGPSGDTYTFSVT